MMVSFSDVFSPIGKLLSDSLGGGSYAADGIYVPPPVTAKPPATPTTPPNLGVVTTGGEHSNGQDTTVGPTAKPVNPAGDPPTTVFLDKLVQDNCLNAYWQSTYHFKLFMLPDKDIVRATGATSYVDLLLRMGGGSVPKVIIAESGVTSYNIKDVEINTVVAQNAHTREQTGTTFSMSITEPLGISFLDALYGAATLLGMKDYTKGLYYIECTFLGYSDDGSPANPAAGFPNGGTWVWAVQLTDVHTKVDENGGQYKLNFVISDAAPIILENKVLSPQVLNKQIKIQGATVGAMLTDYASQLNKQWLKEYDASGGKGSGLPLYNFKIDASAPIPFGPGKGKVISTLQITPDSPPENPDQHMSMDTESGTPTMTISPGATVNETIVSIIKSSKDARQLVLDEKVDDQLSLSSSQVNDRGYRESVLFSVETDIENSDKQDGNTGNMYKNVTLRIVPFYTQSLIMSRPQVDNATTDPQAPSRQQQMVQAYANNGFINKRYDYIFTGLNTEVLDFNIEFNLAWQAQLPKMAGAYLDYRTQRVNKKLNAVNLSKSGTTAMPDDVTSTELLTALNTSNLPASVRLSPVQNGTGIGNSSVSADLLTAFNQVTLGTLPDNAKNPSAPPSTTPSKTSPQMTSGTVYIEDVLTNLNQNQPVPALPISFNHGWLDPAQGNGIAPVNKSGRAVPLTGAAVMQEYSKTLATGAFQTAKLTIRGDPFWLGQTNLERQVAVRQKKPYTPQTSGAQGANLPDWVSGNQVILLRFQYPSQIGDDSTPILRGSVVFNGLYEVTVVKHTFSDGVFKQEINAVRLPLINAQVALGTAPPNGKITS